MKTRRSPLAAVLAFLFVMSLAVSPPAPAEGHDAAEESAGTTTIILVRHAEKTAERPDPGLTEAGEARAQALAHVLGETRLDAIFSTPFARTRATAAPLAKARGMEVIVTPADETYIEETARRIREEHRGQTVLVVGHSNTTPAVIGALGVPEADVPEIDETEYDDLYLVTLDAHGRASLVSLRYGAETP